MMDHHYFEEILEDYARGHLSEKQQADVYSHVISCGSCQTELKFLEKYFDSVSKVEAPLPPPDFLAQVRKKIDALPQKKFEAVKARIYKPLLNWRLVGLVCSCLILISVLIVHQNKLPVMSEPISKAPPDSPAKDVIKENERAKTSPPPSLGEPERDEESLAAENQLASKIQEEDKSEAAPLRKAAPQKSSGFEDAREAGRRAAEMAKGQQPREKKFSEESLPEEATLSQPSPRHRQKLKSRAVEKSMEVMSAPSPQKEIPEASAEDVLEEEREDSRADEELSLRSKAEASVPKRKWPEKHWIWNVSRKDSAKIKQKELLGIVEGQWESQIFKKGNQQLDIYIPREQLRPLLKQLIIAGYSVKENNQAHQLEDIYIRFRF